MNMAQSRDRKSENFPVGSVLISAKLRKIVHLYYNFARMADDISDSQSLSASEKREELLSMERTLNSGVFSSEKEAIAADLGRALTKRKISLSVAGDLLKAFLQDTEQSRYQSWDDLMGYCANSAAPVGRFLLAIHREKDSAHKASDALCASLQVLNHLQDVQKDLRDLDRCYLPLAWVAEEGVSLEDLLEEKSSPALRQLFDRILDHVDLLNEEALALPKHIADKRLKMEASVIVNLAHSLAKRLRKEDPLAQNVSLNLIDKLKALFQGASTIFMKTSQPLSDDKDGLPCAYHDMEVVEAQIMKAQTSFYKGMRILPRARREAMYAIYALCRELDDIADGDSIAGKDISKSFALLEQWSKSIHGLYNGHATTPLERILQVAISRYNLEERDFQEIIEGMKMDLNDPIVFPDEKTLDLYFDRVASAVGRLSVKIFGAEGEEGLKVAYHLGRALQQVNILRDIEADLRLGRCYLPKELAKRFQLSLDLDNLLSSEALPEICKILAVRAKDSFRRSEYYMRQCPPKTMLPARLMAASYKATLQRLENRGWTNLKTPLKKSPFWKVFFLVKALGGK